MSEEDARHVVRTLKTLELLAERSRTAPEIAELLEAHPRTVRRLLRRLVAEGYATEGPRPHEYELTLKVVALSGQVVERTDLVRIAFPYVVRLRNETGEASHLCVPREDGVMHMIQESGENIVSVTSRLGEVVPYHSTAVGKAILAHRQSQWKPLFERGLTRFTERTLTDPAELLLELAAIRERGYATDDQEGDVQLRCCAAPVFDQTGDVVGALGVSAPASRLGTDGFAELGPVISNAAKTLSSALGHGAVGTPNGLRPFSSRTFVP